MLRAQIGQSVVFKTPTKLQHPYCNSFEAIAIGKLDLVLERQNVSLFRDLEAGPIFTLRISLPPNMYVRTSDRYRWLGQWFATKELAAGAGHDENKKSPREKHKSQEDAHSSLIANHGTQGWCRQTTNRVCLGRLQPSTLWAWYRARPPSRQ